MSNYEARQLLRVNGYSDDLKLKIADGQGGETEWLSITESTFQAAQQALIAQKEDV